MNNELQSVIRLQELDKHIATRREWIDSLPQHLREIEKQLSDINAAYIAAKERLALNQRQRRQFDIDVQSLEQKISKYNNQLLDIKTNEEYKAFLHEIEFNKNEIKKIEDKILELMIAFEDDEKHLKQTEAELGRQQASVIREKQEAEATTEKKQKELDALMAERQEAAHSLSDTVMDLYDRTARLRGGVVVAEVQDQICTVCHVMLRPQTFNEVMRNAEIIQCSNCSRILYWNPKTEPVPSPSAPQAEEPARE
jgi:predicted  nucleic acid-binding Zn-ribbon protein